MRDVDALLVVAHETSPARHPAEAAFNDPPAGGHLEARLLVRPPDDLHDEVEVAGLVHQLEPVVGGVGEQVLHPGPTLADGVQDGLGSGAVGEVGRGQTNHQEPPVGVHRDVALAADDLLGPVVTACRPLRGFDGLAVDHRRRGARLAPRPLPVQHQRHVVDGLEQEAPSQFAKPAVDRAPMAEMDRQHALTSARADEVADRVDHLAERDLARTTSPPRLGHERGDHRPLLVRQIRGVALRLPGDLGHPATALLAPHPKLES